jgi:leucyl aminopeptidase
VAVGSGSAHPPRLIELSYQPDSGEAAGPADAAQAHVVLAGKGITFDSGGLSLKTNDSGMNGAKNGQAGSIVAAMFLREFTGGRRWAHLDIAGAARAGSDDGELTKGGTGFGTRLLLRWLTQAGEPQT